MKELHSKSYNSKGITPNSADPANEFAGNAADVNRVR